MPPIVGQLIPADVRTVLLDKRTGFIGITVSNRSPRQHKGRQRSVTEAVDLPGVLVTALMPSGLARAAGLRIGDFVLAVNGIQVNHHADAIAEIDATAKDGPREGIVELTLWGAEAARELVLSRGPAGLTLINVELGPGVQVISAVLEESAAKAGLKRGDVILSINGEVRARGTHCCADVEMRPIHT